MALEHDGKTLYKVVATRELTAVLYVLAESREAATTDAEELIAGMRLVDWDDCSDDAYTTVAQSPPADDDLVWTGGPDGVERTWPELAQG